MRERLHLHGSRWRVLLGVISAVGLLLGVAWTSGMPAAATVARSSSYTPPATGELDCNGFSPVQKATFCPAPLDRAAT
jgi:hypothetical protein